MPADIISSTTQQFLDIYDITNNFVIMKDGTVSVVLTVDAMNFGLLAEEEQDAIMYAYAGLLNSLNYPIQILIHSQTKDVTVYLQLLKDQEEDASSDTMRHRIRQYREFVSNLIHERNVLDKKFYVTIPATALELGILGSSGLLPGQSKFDISQTERSILLEKAQNLLDPKRDHLMAQFARIGLFSRQLSTQEIIQLFYVRYNPEAIEGQQIAESRSYTAPLVQASIQGSTMSDDLTNPLPSPAGLGVPTQPIATPGATTVANSAATAGETVPTTPTMPSSGTTPMPNTTMPGAPTEDSVGVSTTSGVTPSDNGVPETTSIPKPMAPASTDPQPDPVAAAKPSAAAPISPMTPAQSSPTSEPIATPDTVPAVATEPISTPEPSSTSSDLGSSESSLVGGGLPTPTAGNDAAPAPGSAATDKPTSGETTPDEVVAQADLNNAIKGLGTSPTQGGEAAAVTTSAAASTPAMTPSPVPAMDKEAADSEDTQNQSSAMPPLPEI